MPKLELDPAAQAALAELAVEVANNPDTRRDFARLVKKVQPQRRFPDVEIEDIREEMRLEFEKKELEAQQKEATRKLEKQKRSIAEKYDAKAVAEIEAIMEKHGLSDYDLAARLYASETKPATPRPQPSDHRWSLPAIEMKDFNNLKQIGQSKAYQAVDEIIASRTTH